MIHRNLMPFYFAQEQAMKRAGRVILNNPAALREFQMIQQGMNNPGFVHTDPSGQQYIVYPVAGEFGAMVTRGLDALGFKQFTGLPTSVTGSTSSLLSVIPESKMPSVNPFANVAVTDLAKMFPKFMGLSKVADRVASLATGANPFDAQSTGYKSNNFLDTMIPNSTIRDMFNALLPNERESMVHNAMLSAIAAAMNSGQLNKEDYQSMTPSQQQAVMDRIQHNAQTNLMLKGVLSFFLPLSPNVNNDYYTKAMQSFRSEFLQMTLPKSQGGMGMTLAAAQQKFFEEHGDNAVSYTVSSTTSGSGGSSMPLSDNVLKWLGDHKPLMSSHPFAAAYLVPQGPASKDALAVEKTLLAMHLREQRTPADFLNAIYVSKGWSDLQPSILDYQAQVAAARKAGNTHELGVLSAQWKAFTAQQGISNPIWYADYNNPTKSTSAQVALAQLQDLSKKGMLTNSNVVPGIKRLLQSYDDYHNQLQANTYMNGQRHTPIYSQIRAQWVDYLNQEAISDSNLTNVINGVFKRVV
jgi:hypothetical protein